MNALYKRYIPPKASTSVDSATATPTKASPTEWSPVIDSEKKRKRERSADEVAERKAKKLRKKGVDPATVQTHDVSIVESPAEKSASNGESASTPNPTAQPTEDGIKAANAAAEARGDFSHITNIKKRHKLEKEARKAGLRRAGKIDAPTTDVALGSGPEALLVAEAAADQPVEESQAITVTDPVKEKHKMKSKEIERVDSELEVSKEVRQSSETKPTSSKKRRHKLEDVLANGVDPVAENENDKKHTSVLEKFKKSAKRSPVPEEAAEITKIPLETVDHLELPDADLGDDFVPDRGSELPEWLRSPLLVDSKSEKKPWSAMKLDVSTCDRLSKLTFSGAMPIQQALVPLLLPPGTPGARYLPGSEKVLPDLVVSAPTGSGKTVSYLLPITEALRRSSTISAIQSKLGAVVVVPTQELVAQTAAVADALSKGSDVRVGQSNNKHSIRDEQKKLVRRGMRHDPSEYERIMGIANLGQPRHCPADRKSPEYAAWLDASVPDPRTAQQIETLLEPSWPQGFVPQYDSLVDIFVTTPQRLHDHIEETEGFSLEHLTWLVLDEADKMLDNQHRSFLESLNQATDRELHVYRDYSGDKPLAYQPPRLRKVICSATIPSDVKLEHAFQLRFPKLVAERGAETDAQADSGADAYARRVNASGEAHAVGDSMELPRKLVEYTVPVGDGSEKPLVAIELLKSRVLKGLDTTAVARTVQRAAKSESHSSSESDPESDLSSSTSSEDSDSASNESSANDSDNENSRAPAHASLHDKARKPQEQHSTLDSTSAAHAPTILIFTGSTESANRLTHLLEILLPAWKPYLTTILKGQPRRTKLPNTDPAIVISTDRAGRGLDGFCGRMFTHVIQYDVPRSLTDYIHRVGRTARAGRGGEAWTLVTHKQAGWFKEEIIRSQVVVRERAIEEVKLARASEEMREAYQMALSSMKEEVERGHAGRWSGRT